MNDDVLQLATDEADLQEVWQRLTDDPEIRGIEVARIDHVGGWQVAVWLAEFLRDEPLESELRQGMAAALGAVPGVTGVVEEDREVWLVTGMPSGRALTEAAAGVVDGLADRARAYLATE